MPNLLKMNKSLTCYNELGVDYAQGYGIGKPVPLDDLVLIKPFTSGIKMNVKSAITLSWLVFISNFSSGAASAEDLMDLSLDELGAIPVTTIATGTSKPIFQSAAVTSCDYCRANQIDGGN